MDNGSQNTHNVVEMTQQNKNSGYAPLAQLEAYWEALRANRIMPKRAEIDPRGIEQALEHSFIVERIAPGIARLRIAGSRLSDIMGMEVRGMPLTSFIAPSSRRQVSDTLEEVFETPATCTLKLYSEQSIGAPALEARMLLLPLKSDLGDVSRILGALVTTGEIGRSPRRFDVVSSSLRPIVAGASSPLEIEKPKLPAKPLSPKPAPAPERQETKMPLPGFAEDKAGFETSTPRRDAPYLRLVKKDD